MSPTGCLDGRKGGGKWISFFLKIVAVAICAAVGASLPAQMVTLSTDAAATTTHPGDGPGQIGDLRHAILNTTSGSTILFNCGSPCTITLNGPLPPITTNLTINGGTLGNVTISGNGKYRVFFVDTGTVKLENLLIRNAVGKGGNGGVGHIACGGGGAGLGGGLFVNGVTAPATVTVSDVYFSSDSAIGGNGCSTGGNSGAGDGGGGGGLGANGGNGALDSGTYVNGGGGGVLGPGANGSTTTLNGAAGGVGGGGGADENGNPGSAPGTGGSGYGTNSAGATGTIDAAGNGGFGGGGGGGVLQGGSGGFGGGGGGGEDNGGAGSVGGGGGGSEGGAGGAGGVVVGAVTGGNGSSGSPFANGSSGGGAAAGPDIFVNQGTLITVNSGTLGASATGGGGGTGAGGGTSDATPVFNYAGTVNGSTTKGPIATALTASAAPDFVVTSTADSGQGTLRAALTDAADFGAGNVTFDPTVFATPQTITLASSLSIPSSTTITGATSGSGTTLTNLVTVSGGGSSSNFSVFSVASGVTNAAINNLIIANGYTTTQGGGVNNLGALTVTNTTFSNNNEVPSSSPVGGGAIYTTGTLTVAGSTFTGNSAVRGGAITAESGTATISSSTFTGNSALASGGIGGAISVVNGTVTITDSTISGNSAGEGGGIENFGFLSVANSILSGNTGGGGDCVNLGGGCPTNGSNGNLVGVAAALSSLGSYGGPTQTMVPLPGSPAICALNPSTATGTDQRGDPRTTSYGTATCQDSGAVQSHYAISFTTDPAAAETSGVAFPVAITLTESSSPFRAASESIPVTLSSGATLSGSPVSASTSTSNGVASYSLTATNATSVSGLKLNASLTLHAPTAVIAAQSASFTLNPVIAPVASAAFNPTTIIVGGTSRLTITVTNPNAVALTNVQFTDTLPSGIAYVSFLAGDCGTFNVNGGTFSITESSLGANSSCSVAVQVQGNTVTTATDSTSTITSSNAPTGAAATATLTVEGGLVWVINANGTLAGLSEDGTLATTAGTAGTVGTLGAVAFDNAGDVWAVANGTSAVTEFTSTGTVIAVPGNAGAGVNTPTSLAVDGLGQIWVSNGNNSVSVLSANGTAVTSSTGYQGGGISTPAGIIIDNSGSVWIPNKGNNSVTKIIGGAAPVVTPTVTGTTNNTLGTRP